MRHARMSCISDQYSEKTEEVCEVLERAKELNSDFSQQTEKKSSTYNFTTIGMRFLHASQEETPLSRYTLHVKRITT